MDRIRAKFCKRKWKENSLDLYSKLGIEAEVAKYRFNSFK
mgnify:CR=1 FL=1